MLFQKKTIDGVLSVFTKAIADLEQISNDAAIAIYETKEKIATLSADVDEASVTVARADAAIEKLKQFTL